MHIWTLPEVGASGWAGGDDGAGGYMPLAIVSGTTPAINWVHSHHNAKPILLTNASGVTVAYTGHAVLGFPGQFANAVGLAGAQYYYNRYRDYNDVTGRYIQADPIGLAGDANPYAYAMGNTLRYVDPMGLDSWRVAFRDQPIHAPGGGTIPQGISGGHSGNIAVNQATGSTAYREYGRYNGRSQVRGLPVADLSFNNGVPTNASVARLVRNIVELGANGGSSDIAISISLGNSFASQMAYANRIQRNPGEWQPWNNCHTFADAMSSRGQPFFPTSRRFRINPNNQAASVAAIIGFYSSNAAAQPAIGRSPASLQPQKPDWILK